MALAACVVLASPGGCKHKVGTGTGTDPVLELIRTGHHQQALELVEGRIASDATDVASHDLRVSLLSSMGRTPEAASAYVERVQAGGGQDALLLEHVVLSSYPSLMRADAARVTTRTNPPHFGEMTASAVKLALARKPDELVPEQRVADLVGLMGIDGDDHNLEALVDLVEQKTRPAIRYAALRAVVEIGTPAAAQALADIARQFEASQLMQRQILDAAALRPALDPSLAAGLLSSPHLPVRSRAAGALRHSTHPKASSYLREHESIEALAALLGRGEAKPDTLQILRTHVSSLGSPLERSRFIGLLRETAGDATVPLGCDLAISDEPAAATSAISLLAYIGHDSAGPCLAQAAMTDKEPIRHAALRALIDIPAPEQVPDLIGLTDFAIGAGDTTTAALAIGAIGRAGTEPARTYLDRLRDSPERSIRSATGIALYHLGSDDALDLVEEAFEDQTGPWAIYSFFEWRLLARDPDERTLPLVERAVLEGNPSMRDKVLESLIEQRLPQAVFLLEASRLPKMKDFSLEHRNAGEGKVSWVTDTVLSQMRQRQDAEGRRVLLEKLLESDDLYLSAVALRHFETADGKWAVEQCMKLMKDAQDPWLRLEATRSLAIVMAGWT
jgi:HEAT repeat protein